MKTLNFRYTDDIDVTIRFNYSSTNIIFQRKNIFVMKIKFIVESKNFADNLKVARNSGQSLNDVLKTLGNKLDTNIIIENFECRTCGEQYPLKFKIGNESEPRCLIKEYKEPEEGNFIILESLDFKKNEKYCKSIHIVKLNKDSISIGREYDNDIVESDISISRSHAVLKFNRINNKICLQNRSKKFGTLVLVKKPIKILDKKIHLQVGRTYIEANLDDKKNHENDNLDK